MTDSLLVWLEAVDLFAEIFDYAVDHLRMEASQYNRLEFRCESSEIAGELLFILYLWTKTPIMRANRNRDIRKVMEIRGSVVNDSPREFEQPLTKLRCLNLCHALRIGTCSLSTSPSVLSKVL